MRARRSPARRARLARSLTRARWEEYRELLRTARDRGYRLYSVEEWIDGEQEPGDERALVLRHDVDQAPGSALRMLHLDDEHGARATWYFRWRTARPAVVREVRASGAGVGLHYETLTRMVLERRLPAAAAAELVEEARAELRAEIAAFQDRFGPIRSVCPHGDTRVEGVRNAVLLEGEDLRSYGVEFDGNAAMRGRRPACWLTDRVAADGRWGGEAEPSALFADGVSPILCVTHPNNWTSGLTLWGDRLARTVLAGRAGSLGLADRPPGLHV